MRIEKTITLRAPRSRVWRALTVAEEFGEWFRVKLEDAAGGTVLTLTESGFGRIPLSRRAEAFRMNDNGWSEQLKNIERHVPQP